MDIPPNNDPVPVPISPPPPPPCDCFADAPAASFVTTEDGLPVFVPPPDPLTADMIPVLSAATGTWGLATRGVMLRAWGLEPLFKKLGLPFPE